MSKTSQFMQDLYEIEALEEALKHQLERAEQTLAELFNKREKAIKTINNGRFDLFQYQLDDLQQKLGNVIEEFSEIAPVESILISLISE